MRLGNTDAVGTSNAISALGSGVCSGGQRQPSIQPSRRLVPSTPEPGRAGPGSKAKPKGGKSSRVAPGKPSTARSIRFPRPGVPAPSSAALSRASFHFNTRSSS